MALLLDEGSPLEHPHVVLDTDTFRIRGVPLDWNSERLEDFLVEKKNAKPKIKSLGAEIDSASLTATVIFEDLCASPLNERDEQISLSNGTPGAQGARPQSLVLDKAFLGITTLYMPPQEDHMIDVIALSGLGGHAFGSFKERGGDHMWLRDSLPYDLISHETGRPIARVMAYGHESTVANSESFQNIEDLATEFHSSLLELTTTSTLKPIILIAHSLGGLIVKQALMALSESENEDDQSLLAAIYGIVFFGVPHDGMDVSSLILMVGNKPNRALIESISHINSQVLTIQQRNFPKALGREGQTEVFCFYETLQSPTAKLTESGGLEMQGPHAVLVTKSSATHCRPWEDGAEHICAIARTHSNIVKFGPQDHEYSKVRTRLKGLSKRALTVRHRIQADTEFLIPYNKNPDFVERSGIIDTINQRLDLVPVQGAVKRRDRVALYGLGGVGKTQIAISYAYSVRHSLPDVSIFWVHASSESRFRESYASIATACNIPGYDDPEVDLLGLVKAWLERKGRKRWLMVIDNADDKDLFYGYKQGERALEPSASTNSAANGLGRYIPESERGFILITTRNKQAGSRLTHGKSPIEVGRMNDNEACKLLRGILEDHIISEDEASLLSSKLEYLPLALAQAATFILEVSISLQEYVQLIDKSNSILLDRLSEEFETAGRDSSTSHAVATTWFISFDQIKRNNSFDSDILSFMSFFHCQSIPRSFMEDYHRRLQPNPTGPIDAVPLIKALGTLKAFCFISEDKNQTFTMHRLVQLVTRKWLELKAADFALAALKTISYLFPYGKFETREECLRLLPHANALLDNYDCREGAQRIPRAELLVRMGTYFIAEKEWDVAAKHQEESVTIFKDERGLEHFETVASISNLALTYSRQGQWDKAEKLQLKVMEACNSKLGPDHPRTLDAMNNLALTYNHQGQWNKAEKLQLKVMEACNSKLGPDHPRTLNAMNNLASTYIKQGQWDKAEKLQLETLEAYKSKLGADHPDILDSMNNLVIIYIEQGRWDKAEKLQLEALEARKSKLGADHPRTLDSMNNLAIIYNQQGQHDKAEKLQLEALEARKSSLGADHPDILVSMNNLAIIYDQQGQHDKAEKLQLETLEAQKSKLGADHPDTLVSMYNLARTWYTIARRSDAIILAKECIGIQRQKLGPDHPQTRNTTSVLRKWEIET